MKFRTSSLPAAFAALLTVSLLTLSLLAGCDKGLAPREKATISGTIKFRGDWPTADSGVAPLIAVVLLKPPPPYAADALLSWLDAPDTMIFQSVNYRSADTTFTLSVEPGRYDYLAVAHHYTKRLDSGWAVAGVALDERDSIRTFDLSEGMHLTDADIVVDFNSIPWQPFR